MSPGVANAQYASVLEAVQKMPELSTIAKRVGDAGGLTKTLSDPKWVGTVFIPTNAVSTHCVHTASMCRVTVLAALAHVPAGSKGGARVLQGHVVLRTHMTATLPQADSHISVLLPHALDLCIAPSDDKLCMCRSTLSACLAGQLCESSTHACWG
jgi:hypothetical protein